MIENLIHDEISKTAGNKLAKYANEPAIFINQAPQDADKEWGDKQYPRIDYYLEFMDNPERNTQGLLTINIWCKAEEVIYPELIGDPIMSKFNNLFLNDDKIVSFKWRGNRPFVYNQSETLKVEGLTLIFDVFEYPLFEYEKPDPIEAISRYTKEKLPNCKILGIDELEKTYKPLGKENIVYWRIGSTYVDIDTSSFSITWIEANLVGEFAGEQIDNNMMNLQHNLALDQEAITNDGSPMFIWDISSKKSDDTGQIICVGRFGILRDTEQDKGEPLKDIILTGLGNDQKL